jgi:hypothetical protein
LVTLPDPRIVWFAETVPVPSKLTQALAMNNGADPDTVSIVAELMTAPVIDGLVNVPPDIIGFVNVLFVSVCVSVVATSVLVTEGNVTV